MARGLRGQRPCHETELHDKVIGTEAAEPRHANCEVKDHASILFFAPRRNHFFVIFFRALLPQIFVLLRRGGTRKKMMQSSEEDAAEQEGAMREEDGEEDGAEHQHEELRIVTSRRSVRYILHVPVMGRRAKCPSSGTCPKEGTEVALLRHCPSSATVWEEEHHEEVMLHSSTFPWSHSWDTVLVLGHCPQEHTEVGRMRHCPSSTTE